MIKNYYWAMAVMAAFVAGTIATATPVFAPPPEDEKEGGWKAELDMLPKSTYRAFGDSDIVSLGEKGNANAACDEGDILLSCGYNGNENLRFTELAPNLIHQSCFVAGIVVVDTITKVQAIALCADIDPPH